MSNSSAGVRRSPDQRRAQIVDVAAAHFSRDGVAGASMTAIAAEAGITRALVYHYFPGRERLLEAVLEREANRVLVATAPDPALSQRANVERALAAFFEHFAASSGAVRELYTPTTPERTSTAARLAASNHQVQVQRLLAATGTADTEQSRLAMGAWLAFVEYTGRHAADAPTTPVQAHLDLCVNALESTLGRPLLT
ncbi:TetR/AcrR family transcriptional regulator [Microbacterium sp. NPDC058389]|uniref:TetR/AcrR family transcriptional regulator n=1 Tax=Microbacterium sp. NPDC058389 TaxID=3346475 RepID=UPI003647C944